MKKLVAILLTLVTLSALSACGSDDTTTEESIIETSSVEESTAEAESDTQITAEEAIIALQEKITDITSVVVYDEETDPNGLLGRVGEYIGKADFYDSRLESETTEAGTIEVFSSESDCDDRYEYLSQFADSSLGILGLNQYVYKYDLAVFRVSYDLTPSQAEEYKEAMDEIMGEVSEQYGV